VPEEATHLALATPLDRVATKLGGLIGCRSEVPRQCVPQPRVGRRRDGERVAEPRVGNVARNRAPHNIGGVDRAFVARERGRVEPGSGKRRVLIAASASAAAAASAARKVVEKHEAVAFERVRLPPNRAASLRAASPVGLLRSLAVAIASAVFPLAAVGPIVTLVTGPDAVVTAAAAAAAVTAAEVVGISAKNAVDARNRMSHLGSPLDVRHRGCRCRATGATALEKSLVATSEAALREAVRRSATRLANPVTVHRNRTTRHRRGLTKK
jgi:hypothetical protein